MFSSDWILLLLRLGGDSSGGRQTRNGVAVCSQKRALCVTTLVLGALLLIALVIAYGPQNGMSFATSVSFERHSDLFVFQIVVALGKCHQVMFQRTTIVRCHSIR